MKIWLIWFWNTGKVIKKVLEERGHEATNIVTLDWDKITWNVDVYIDFSSHECIFENVKTVCSFNIPIVIWTTWWYDKKDEMKNIITSSWNTCIWAWNFSIWVNLLYSIISHSTQVIDKFNDTYDVFMHEYHHNKKADSPSWTALEIWNYILASSGKKNKIITESLNRKIESNELHVSSTRWWSVPWTHEVSYDSLFDTISIKHTARTREGFALWSVIAAENINKMSPWIYNFSEIFDKLY